MRWWIALAAATAFATTRASAQQSAAPATLLGRVSDVIDGGGIAHATINILGTNLVAHSDGWGYFSISGIHPGQNQVVIRALGYAKLTESQDLSAGAKLKRDFSMTRVPHTLTQMIIEGRSMRVPRGMESIYRRGALGFGHFFTREQIDSLNPIDLKSILQTIPGVNANARGVTFATCGSGIPQLWVDGQNMTRFDPIYSQEEFLEILLPTSVQAMEVYTSHVTVPAEFLSGSPCGVIAIWTRRGP